MAEVLDLEHRRLAACVDADVGVLRELLHPRLTYCHSSGARDDYVSLLDKIGRGHFDYQRIAVSDERIVVESDTAVLTAVQDLEVVIGSEYHRMHNTTLAVWVRGRSGWSLIAYQPTPLR